MSSSWDIFDSAEELLSACHAPSGEDPAAQVRYAASRERVLGALVGGEAVPMGVTFLPVDALAGMRWGTAPEMPRMLAALAEQAHLDFAFVPAWEPWADEAIDRLASAGAVTFWVVPGPLGLLASCDGWSEVLRRTAIDGSALAGDLKAVLPEVFEHVRRGARRGAAAVVVAEDLAGTEGLLISPDHAIDIVFPTLEAVAACAAEEGLLAVWHSDGDIRALVGAARRSGFTGIHVGALSGEQLRAVLQSARGVGMSLIGGVPGDELRAGAASAVAAGHQAAILSRDGGMLVADDGGLTTPEEIAGLLAAIAAARDGADREESSP